MIGPMPQGTYTNSKVSNHKTVYDHLVVGKTYQVIKEFADHDREVHLEGETWKFLGYSYNHHDEGLSLFVTLDDIQEWHIPLQGSPEEQGHMVNSLISYIHEVKL